MFGKHCNNLSVHDCSCVLGGHRLRDRPGFSQQVHLSRTPRMTWQGSRKVRWTCSLSPWLYSKPIPTYSHCGQSVTPFAVECLLIKGECIIHWQALEHPCLLRRKNIDIQYSFTRFNFYFLFTIYGYKYY